MNWFSETYQAILNRKATDEATKVLVTVMQNENGALSSRQEGLLSDYQSGAYKDHLAGAVSGISSVLVLKGFNLTQTQLRFIGAPLALSTYAIACTAMSHYRAWAFVHEIINDPNTRLAKSMKKAYESVPSL
jgi:hypothetical protein